LGTRAVAVRKRGAEIEPCPKCVEAEAELVGLARRRLEQLARNGVLRERFDPTLHEAIAGLRSGLHAHPFGEPVRSFSGIADLRKRVGAREPKLGCASRAAGRVGTGASTRQLRADIVPKRGTTHQCEPTRRQLVQLHLRVLARAARIVEEPLDTATPIATVEHDLAGQTLNRVSPTCLVSDS